MSFRRAAKKDANHVEIVECFRSLGFSVLDVAQLKHCCDVIVSKCGVTIAVEIKDGTKTPSGRKLTIGELSFAESWQGRWELIESVEDVIALNQSI